MERETRPGLRNAWRVWRRDFVAQAACRPGSLLQSSDAVPYRKGKLTVAGLAWPNWHSPIGIAIWRHRNRRGSRGSDKSLSGKTAGGAATGGLHVGAQQ